MSGNIQYKCNTASAAQITDHLLLCDTSFVPQLSSRVDICEYASKIYLSATRFEAWKSDELVGLVAAYSNAEDRRLAFVTTVSVLPKWSGIGIASRLLEECISKIRDLGFIQIDLDVGSMNFKAISLYEQHGFSTTGAIGGMLRMVHKLKEGI